jgi:tetratricopeptide (TPR) repeat protein
MPFVSYATPLELAKRWSHSGEQSVQVQALELLKGLFARFPHSIEIGQQLALTYLETGAESEAKSVLDELQLLCRNPNEEVLSRCGRVYRDRGDRFVEYPDFPGLPEGKIGGAVENSSEALRYYRLALQEYSKAYQIRLGHYPGVNVATLYLLIAAFESNDAARDLNLENSKRIAQALLARISEWPLENKDDPIWHAATAGELYLLLREWQSAHTCYRSAVKHDLFESFHRNSMLKQVIRIVYCQKRLGVPSLGPFDDLHQVFVQ